MSRTEDDGQRILDALAELPVGEPHLNDCACKACRDVRAAVQRLGKRKK